MKKSIRSQRFAECIQNTVNQLLLVEVRDPRLAGAVAVAVEVSNDLGYATVFFSLPDESKESQAGALQALKKASGFFRSHLAKELSSRSVPVLRFKFDNSASRGEYISRLIDAAIRDEIPMSDTP